MTKTPTICLNMIVRNESHVIRELFDSIAPFITTWVIVDTGSDDGTQDLIREYFADRGIPGLLHERPWRNFGANRTEAVQLAQGHADYILTMDADDVLFGTPDLSNMTADSYKVPIKYGDLVYQRRHLFRDGLPWRWVGVVHEYVTCDTPCTEELLPGDFWIQARTVGARSQDPDKYLRDAELLLAEVHRNPDDDRSVFYLAQSYRDYGDLRSARQWYARRAEMGGWPEEVFCSLLRVAECTAALGEPWPLVQDAYLKAWAYRPVRAEPLCAIATHYRSNREWQLGYFFAKEAAQIPLPTDILFVRGRVYSVTAIDELAICASWLGKHEESFRACQRLLASDDLNDVTRSRVVLNRNFAVPTMLEISRTYPKTLAHSLTQGSPDSEVTVTFIAGRDRSQVELTLNSFLNCCSDIDRIGRFLLIDTGLDTADRRWLAEHYPFLEISPDRSIEPTQIHNAIEGRFWLHLDQGWQFFAPEPLVGRLTAILDTEPALYQVGLNLDDATKLDNQSALQSIVRSYPDTGRYTLTTTPATGPAMYDMKRINDYNRTTATLAEIIAVKQDP
ncbi:tetratricopeptide repeat-containing glycosyltransferase [Mycolicibacterium helvum]|uniref:Glycosyltransferase 2-like domain-containing protein n=1 Tax=Mycolicibacterium helvum TaxID=1534349 RepID=A0A7I7T377_9MYCO|nr:glycosyltransferase [Mycolicibacterium helvum]BBY62971.1 hypothetical protein MHEL_12140 [Mycolicibacterium helvum]